MSNKNQRRITFAAILSLAVVALFYFAMEQKLFRTPNQNQATPLLFNEQEYWQRPRQYMLGYISAIPSAEYDKYFASGSIVAANGEKINLFGVYYMPNSPNTVINKIKQGANHPEDERGTYRGGIITFFKQNSSFSINWESKEYFSAMKGITEFRDINSDGIDELVLTAGQGVRLIPALWIYQWNGSGFTLINPNPGADKESDRWMAGISAQLEDIDNDKILEAVVVNEETSQQTGEAEPIRRIYKFNGTEYYLWKEETIPQ